ncbi:hypothetical protein [Arsenicibacter rosenii]|uniref:DUF4412 domain-containing protein n=1 Tax=Arsenicibacter rosenii TaxID=1750698 RepID=A0A1S2VI59_9BACT|nr:hypothetical protein [Arsenicibacter rosenii]OIN58447.1 hypothetical protein BLX24_15780 [Arsenicibacter rosenii]
MKKIALLIAFTFLTFSAVAQNFEGRILYKNSFYLPNGQDVTASATRMMGTEQDYYINAKHYKSLMNGQMMTMQLYRSDENKYYSVDGNNTAQSFDGSTESGKITKVEKLDGTFDVLGRKCKGVVLISNTSKTTYYYDESMKVNIATFSKHKFGNWIDYLQASGGALPLAFIVENPQYTWKSEAVKVEPMKLDDSAFTLPKGVKMKM